jgi:hypothetical protein
MLRLRLTPRVQMFKIRIAALLLAANIAALAHEASAEPVVVGDYYEDIGGMGTCPLDTSCILWFSEFPASTAGKVITITEVGCDITDFSTLVGGQTVLIRAYVEITNAGSNARRKHPINASGKSFGHSFNEPLNFRVSGGSPRRPRLVLISNVTSRWGGSCTLTGKITSN